MPYIGRDLNQGNYLKLDDISSQFNGSKVSFDLTTGGTAFFPGSSMALLVALGGVLQEAEAAYTIDQSSIEFASAPTSSQNCFIIVLGSAIGVSVPADASVTMPKLAQSAQTGEVSCHTFGDFQFYHHLPKTRALRSSSETFLKAMFTQCCLGCASTRS